ncbi:L,D-transpeptidase [Rubrivivax sp. RP6-9]|uniref:L,D-transpeptidase n=1 Tax=Rubrivivax sp. RP6-9 TaxID=3415750 RepID=UPI003CC604CA
MFDARGALVGPSAALLGRAWGDQSAPGVGLRTQERRPSDSDRTTPAGQFASEPGRKHESEAVVWIDYSAALAIHRLRGHPDRAGRLRRLARDDPAARRVSDGCVVVPEAFYDAVVQPLLCRQRGWVLVMPEAPQQPMRAAGAVGARPARREHGLPVGAP